MALLGIAGSHKTTILPEGGRDFLRRRLMELVGTSIAAIGVLLLMAVFTFNTSDPSLNHATGNPPTEQMKGYNPLDFVWSLKRAQWQR